MSSATLLPEPDSPLTTIRRIGRARAAQHARRCRARAARWCYGNGSGRQLRAVPVARGLRIAVLFLVAAHLLVELARQQVDRGVNVVVDGRGMAVGAGEADGCFG